MAISTATGLSSDFFSTSSGWVQGNLDITTFADGPPAGKITFQYQNSFNAVATPPGPGWNTWSTVNKPAANAYGITRHYIYSAPYPHVDTSVAGSTDTNYGYGLYYLGINQYILYTYTYSNASATKPDTTATAETQALDPTTLTQPSGGGDWTLQSAYDEIGAFSSGAITGDLSGQQSLTLTPPSSAASANATTYNLLSVAINANGTASVTTDLNNNNAVTSGTLDPGELNGYLLVNGVQETASQATAYLESFYNSSTGTWNLNPNGVGLDPPSDSVTSGGTGDLGSPSNFNGVFNIETVVYLDNSTASATLTTGNESDAAATPACYARGTRILTDNGEMPVEDLRIGDHVITASGLSRPIRWIGYRSYGARFAARNPDIPPVLITRGALDDDMPRRDLRVSPRHAMFLDGVLVPAIELVNGKSIIQCRDAAPVAYVHIELDSHDVIMAEGALSETFIDDDSRMMFHNASEYARLYPDAAPVPARYCAPRVTSGFALEAIRHRIALRAGLRAARPAEPLRGHIDRVSPGLVEGWAQNQRYPEAPVCLDVLVEGVVVALTLANQYRPDLRAAGLGSGHHAFSVRLPTRLARSQLPAVRVRRSADHVYLPRTQAATRAA